MLEKSGQLQRTINSRLLRVLRLEAFVVRMAAVFQLSQMLPI